MQQLLNKMNIRVAVVDDNAYWVYENMLYCAPIDKDGSINMKDAEKVDVFSLSEKEAKELLNILDSISD
jgi:hypothetical protein